MPDSAELGERSSAADEASDVRFLVGHRWSRVDEELQFDADATHFVWLKHPVGESKVKQDLAGLGESVRGPGRRIEFREHFVVFDRAGEEVLGAAWPTLKPILRDRTSTYHYALLRTEPAQLELDVVGGGSIIFTAIKQ
jgi:hypothetical protein